MGHIVCASHFSPRASDLRAGTFITQETDRAELHGSSQVPPSRLQTIPLGQQWMWSSQQTAWQVHRNRNGVNPQTRWRMDPRSGVHRHLRQRTAGPGAAQRRAAGVISRTRCDVITFRVRARRREDVCRPTAGFCISGRTRSC